VSLAIVLLVLAMSIAASLRWPRPAVTDETLDVTPPGLPAPPVHER
jgi:hypothetical protein